MAPHVSQFINNTSKSLPVELMACLKYTDHAGLFIYDYYIPEIKESTKFGVRGGGCKSNEILFHNHPFHDDEPGLQNYYFRETGDILVEPNQMVYMSSTDMINMLMSDYKYTVVAANGEYAWWTKTQVREAWLKDIRLLQPIQGQTSLTLTGE